jgi:hypothetical protein
MIFGKPRRADIAEPEQLLIAAVHEHTIVGTRFYDPAVQVGGVGMQTGLSPARGERVRLRHELHSLTYITLDQGNGGVLRNLSHDGVAAQAVAAVRLGQKLRVRFELTHPRLRVETDGEVVWSTSTGQCGIRFLGLTARTQRQIDEWIFGNLLERFAPHANQSMFHNSHTVTGPILGVADQDDGLILSPAPVKVIALPERRLAEPDLMREPETTTVGLSLAVEEHPRSELVELDWLSRPLSGRSLAWSVDVLAVLIALLLCVLIFLSITREPPRWPSAMIAGAGASVAACYWGFFKLFGGTSFGTRLARLVEADQEAGDVRDTRFR